MDELVPNLPPLSVGDQTNPTTNLKKSKEQINMILPHERVIRATPVARRIAKELGIDLAFVTGSGPEERISEQDVRTYAEAVASGTTKTTKMEREFELVSLNNIQRLTGERMLESVHIAPQFALTVGVDMTNALLLYDALATKIEVATGKKLSIQKSWSKLLLMPCVFIHVQMRLIVMGMLSFGNRSISAWRWVLIMVWLCL